MLSAELWNKGEQFWVWGSIRTNTEPDWWAELCDLSHPSQGLDWCPLTKVVPLNDVTKTTGTWHYCLLSAVTVLSTGISIDLLIHTVTLGRQVLVLHFTDGRSKAQSKLPKITTPNWRAAELGFREGGCSLELQGTGFFSTIYRCPSLMSTSRSICQKDQGFPQSFWVTFKKVCKFYDPEQSHVNFSLKI